MILGFAADLVAALRREAVPPDIENEQALERRFVVPLATRIAAGQQDVLLYSHPFRNKKCCAPGCMTMPPGGPGRVVGCPRCWAKSKPWASVAAFGTHDTFDLVVRDHSQTLAVEIKLVAARGGRMPNGEIQRFLGQCSLAAMKHDLVIGMCGYRGRLSAKWRRDSDKVKKWFDGRDVQLVFRRVG